MRGHCIGGFGSVTTNKVIATIGGDVFGKDVQAYPKYGSEKKGLPTTYYLTIAESHIYAAQRVGIRRPGVLNDTTALFSGNPLDGLLTGGAIVMQSTYTEPRDVWQRIPEHHKNNIREKNLRVYFADMVQDRPRSGLGGRLANAHAGHCAAGRILKTHALRPPKRHDRRTGLRRRGKGLAKILRQTRRSRGARQHAMREARLSRVT